MSDKISGVELQNCKSPTTDKWAQIAGDPSYNGSLILLRGAVDYFFFGDDAGTAAKTLGRTATYKKVLIPQLRVKRAEMSAVCDTLRVAGIRVVICGEGSGKMGGHWRAHVDVTMGDRRVSNFMANAGLGITGYGTKQRLVFNYSPGEVVDEDRVNAAMENMIAMADAEGAEFKILTFKVVKLEFIPE